MPTVTGFTANGNLNSGQKGLKNVNRSVTPGVLTGDLSDGLSVTVTATSSLYWTGTLKYEDSKYKVNLTCTNTSTGEGDTEDVSVTAGSSDPFQTQVNVGP
jgi:hypothetical protein